MKNIFSASLFLFFTIMTSAQNDIIVEGGGVAPGNTSTEVDGMIRFNGSSLEYFSAGAWTPLVDSTATSGPLWFQNNNDIHYDAGNIGIGTANPTEKLHIGGSGNIMMDNGVTHVRLNSFDGGGPNVVFNLDPIPENSTGSSSIRFFRTTNSSAEHSFLVMKGNNTTDVSHKFSTTGDSYLNAFGGNVGIGTNSPEQKLHLANSGNILLDNGITSVVLNGYTSGAAGGVIYQIDPKPANDSTAAVVRLFRSTNSTANHALMIMRGNNTTQTNHKFSTLDDSYLSSISGNVGVGTASPTSKLTVLDDQRNSVTIKTNNNLLENGIAFQNGGDAYSWNIFRSDAGNNNAQLIFAGGDANADISLLPERMRIDDNGFVGIGRPVPQQRLHVGGKIRSSFSGTSGEYIEIWHGGGNGFINTAGDGNLDFRHDNNTMMSLLPTGKVTIGTVATPGNYNLYVENGILTEEVKVAIESSSDWSDDAFYRLPTIEAMQSSIEEKSHLLGMPSATELVKTGYSVTDMDAKLLAQIEWQWMYLIQQKEENEKLEEKNKSLENRLAALEKLVAGMVK